MVEREVMSLQDGSAIYVGQTRSGRLGGRRRNESEWSERFVFNPRKQAGLRARPETLIAQCQSRRRYQPRIVGGKHVDPR
jgi:hypothetical protein